MILIPIGHEDQKVVRLPWVTIALVLANVAVFLITHGVAQRQSDAIHQQLREVVGFAQEHPYLHLPPQFARVIRPVQPPAELPADTLADQQAQLDNLLQHLKTLSSGSVFRTYGYTPAHPSLLTLFTSMFLHAGWLHLLGNMLFLWLTGTSLEDRWGRILFPILYLVSGAVATLTHGFMHPQSTIPLVGASGAIAGLMGAFLVRLATTRIKFFYWFFFRGTFQAPAYVVLPLWLLQQFAMVRGEAGGVAVWAHIGGFGLGVAAALLIRLTDLEGRLLAPAIQEKTSWKASEQLTAALEQLDRGETEAAIKKLEALVRATPNSIEARTALLASYARKEDHAAAGRESAQLVGAYVRARDMDGALAAAEEHARTYKDVPISLRNLLFLAAHREKRGEHAEAAQVYQQAIAAWPDDPLTPRALAAYGRTMLRTFHDPRAAMELLEQARMHPKVTPEILKFSQELLAEGREALGRPEQPVPAIPPAAPEPAFSASSPSLPEAQTGEAPGAPEPTLSAPSFSRPEATPMEEVATASEPVVWELSPGAALEAEPEPEGPGASGPSVPEPAPEPPSTPSQPEPQVELELETPATVPPESPAPPTPALQVEEGPAEEPLLEVAPAPPPQRSLVAVPMRAVGLDARGLQLQARTGGTGRLAWQHVAALSVGSLGAAQAPDPVADGLILDLYLAPSSTAAGITFHSVRLGVKDLAVPQLQGETSPVRIFQRFVATILKATTATPYPSREACLGVRGFPAYPDLAAYEADLLPRLPGPE